MGMGADGDEARRIFDLYVDRGGNFIDTAVNYTDGGAERLLGTFIGDKREWIVLATKFTMARDPGNPNSGGNHRFNMIRSVEQSLAQLGTDRIDLLYLGICNTPAWRIAQLQTLADMRGWSPFVALQIEYSLVERTVEHELLPAAEALGLGVLPWSPLGGGVLTGKYSLADVEDSQEATVSANRKGIIASSGHLNRRAIEIADEVRAVAEEVNSTPSRVALAWTLANPRVVSPIIGARTLAQAEDNLEALDLVFAPEQLERLDRISAPSPVFPARFTQRPLVHQLIFGGAVVERRD